MATIERVMLSREALAVALIKRTVVEFCDRSDIGFSSAGGTVRVLAGEASRFFGIDFETAIKAVNEVCESCHGWYIDAYFDSKGNARGYGIFLQRNIKEVK